MLAAKKKKASTQKSTKAAKASASKEASKALLLAKKKKGKLSYDDLNDILPASATPDQIDEVMVTLNDLKVEIVDEHRLNTETQKAMKQEERKARRAEMIRMAA